MHPVPLGQPTDAHPFIAVLASDTLEQLHPRHLLLPHPWRQQPRSVGLGRFGGGATSGHHSGPYWGQIRLSFPQGGVQRTYLACGTASSTARSTCRQVWSTAANGWSGSVATSTSSSGDRPIQRPRDS